MTTPRPRLILILGGARSGKSRYGEQLATRIARGGNVVYVATATAVDDEMRARIAAHRASRPAAWVTIEEPYAPATALATAATQQAGVVLLDCLTVLVANIMLEGQPDGYDAANFDTHAAEQRVLERIKAVITTYRSGQASLIVVTNEVGMGLVPDNLLGRTYRDILGRVNARIAALADVVLLMVAGLPVEVTALAAQWETRAATLFDSADESR